MRLVVLARGSCIEGPGGPVMRGPNSAGAPHSPGPDHCPGGRAPPAMFSAR